MLFAQIAINFEELLTALAVLAAVFLLFVGGIGWAFARRGVKRLSWGRLLGISLGGLVLAVVAAVAASMLSMAAARAGSTWYDDELVAWLGLPVGIVAYPLAVAVLSRWPNLPSIARARWWRWTVIALVVMTGAVLIEVARPRTDSELLTVIAARKSYGQRARALQILEDRGARAAHLAPQLRDLIRANGRPPETVWEMRTLAVIAPTPETIDLLVAMTDRPYPASAINVLGGMGPVASAAVPQLLELMVLAPGQVAGETHVAAARAVAKIDPRQTADPRFQAVIQEIVSRLLHDNPSYRRGAANQLGQIGPGAASARPELQEIAARDPDLRCRQAAGAALARIP